MITAIIDVSAQGETLTAVGTHQFEIGHDPVFGQNPSVVDTLKCGWTFDGRRLTVNADRLGFIPLFVYQRQHRIIVSNDIAALVARLEHVEPDYDALAVFLRLDFFVGNDTPIKGISVLCAGEVLEWHGSECIRKQGTYDAPAAWSGTRSQALERYVDLFRTSMRRRIKPGSKIALPLSGGRDSRHIYLELLHQNVRPAQLVTAKTPLFGTQEVRAASKLANQFGCEQTVVDCTYSGWVGREQEKNSVTHCLANEHAWYLALDDAIDPSAEFLFDGIGGDVLSNGLFYDKAFNDFVSKKEFNQAAAVVLPDLELDFLSGPMKCKVSLERARDRVAHEIERHVGQPDAAKSFFFWNRTRRAIAVSPICIAARKRQISLPYLDAPLVDFLLGLPGEEYGPAGFHDAAIEQVAKTGVDYAGKEIDPVPPREQAYQFRDFLKFYILQNGYAQSSVRFVLPRIARASLRGLGNEQWWAQSLVYLSSLSMSCGDRLLL